MPKTNDSDEELVDDLRAGLKIDRNSLDDHLLEQPDAFWRISEAVIMATSRRDEIKLDMEQLAYELDKAFRQDAVKNDEKFTEKSILAEIETSPKMMTKRRQFADANLRANKLTAMKEAYRERSSALKELCGLYASNYFTVNTGKRVREEAGDRKAESIREEAGRTREDRLARKR